MEAAGREGPAGRMLRLIAPARQAGDLGLPSRRGGECLAGAGTWPNPQVATRYATAQVMAATGTQPAGA